MEQSAVLLKPLFPAWRKRLKEALCLLLNGKHELYRAHTPDRIFQKCVCCGHETQGWHCPRRGRWL